MPNENEFADWYRSIPVVTRYWFSGSVIVPLIARFGIINPRNLVLIFELIFKKFHVSVHFIFFKFGLFGFDSFKFDIKIWRLLTGLLYYPISPQSGFTYLINLYFLYTYSKNLETGKWLLARASIERVF